MEDAFHGTTEPMLCQINRVEPVRRSPIRALGEGIGNRVDGSSRWKGKGSRGPGAWCWLSIHQVPFFRGGVVDPGPVFAGSFFRLSAVAIFRGVSPASSPTLWIRTSARP